jgi:phosphonate transport system substrate-binding protein
MDPLVQPESAPHGLPFASRRQVIGAALAVPAALAASVARNARAAGTPYLFAPVNQFGVNLTASYWNPILTWVSERTGLALRLKINRTSAETIQSVVAGEVQFSFNNHLFTPEREKLGWKVLARRDTPPVRGVIAVLASSAVRSAEQLAGAEVGFPRRRGDRRLPRHLFAAARAAYRGRTGLRRQP